MLQSVRNSDGWQPVDVSQFRTAMGRFASGITVVTARVDDVDHAMTASAFTSVSLSPPLVLVCVEKIARFHDAILRAGQWGVSVLGASAVDVSTHLARRGRPLVGQLDAYPHYRGRTGAALLSDALAWLECRTWATYDGGDHTIVVGEVVALDVARSSESPLLYHEGSYRTVHETPEGR